MIKKISILLLLVAVFTLALWNKSISQSGNQQWMEDQIQEDLSFFSKEDLNPERIGTSFENAPLGQKLVHFQIKEGKIYWKRNWENEESLDRIVKVCKALSLVNNRSLLPNADFLLTVNDGMGYLSSDQDQNQYLPIFAFAKKAESKNAILIPDPLSEIFSRTRVKSFGLEKMKPKNFWSQKIEKAFWRGGTTGGQYVADNWYQMPRVQLSLLSQYYPDEIDAGFSVFCQVSPDAKEEMLKTLPLHKWVGHKTHLKYKYLVIADGNTCTYPRFYLGLFSGSVVFKDQTENYQWFYRALKPYEHYIPVKADFSDLPEKVKWAKEHDKEAKKIAKNATRFINQNLKSYHIHSYIGKLLTDYSKLQDSDIEVANGMQQYMGLTFKSDK